MLSGLHVQTTWATGKLKVNILIETIVTAARPFGGSYQFVRRYTFMRRQAAR